MFSTVEDQQIIEGDARDILPTIPDESVDFVVTSPPYWSILQKEDHKVKQERLANGLTTDYGDDPRDLAKIESYDDFLKEITRLFGECGRALKSGKYMAIVVSDFRDKSRYIMFHADLSRALETVGLEIRGLKGTLSAAQENLSLRLPLFLRPQHPQPIHSHPAKTCKKMTEDRANAYLGGL